MSFFTILKERLQKQIPRWIVLLIDVHFSILSFVLSLAIVWQTEWRIELENSILIIGVGSLIYLISFLIFKPYAGIVRHTGIEDIIKILQATSVAFLFSIVAKYFLGIHYPEKSLTLLVLHFLFVSNIMIFSRILYKHIYSVLMKFDRSKKNFLIYGAGASGVLTCFALQTDEENENKVVAFVDDNPKLHGNFVKGLNVMSPTEITKEWLAKENVDEIIISIQNIRLAKLNEIVQRFGKWPVKIKLVPLLKDWIDNKLEATQIQEVHIDDLLGRNPINLKEESIRNEVEGKVVLVTGAAGFNGIEFSENLLQYSFKKLILVDQMESALHELEQIWLNKNLLHNIDVEFINADILDDVIVDSVYNRFRPDLVYHANAYKKELSVEEKPYEVIRANSKGTKHLLAAANRYGAEKVVIVLIA